MNFLPQKAPQKPLGVRVEVQAPVTAKLPVRATRVRTLVPAAV
jgi:hypothetical protein